MNAQHTVHSRLACGCTIPPANTGIHQIAHVTSGDPGLHYKLGKECFGSNPKQCIHRIVSRFSHIQSVSVSGKGRSLSGVSGTFSQEGDIKVQKVTQAAGANGIGSDSHPTQPPTHEAVSLVDSHTQAESCAPQPLYKWYKELTDEVGSHKLYRTPSCTGTETFSAFAERPACSGQNRQCHGSGRYQQTRGAAFTSSAHVGTQTDYVEQLLPVITESHPCARHTEPGGRFIVQRQSLLQGLETPQRGGGSDM